MSEVFKHTSSSDDYEEDRSNYHMTLSRSVSQPDFLVNSLSGSTNDDEEGSNSTGDNLPRNITSTFLNRSPMLGGTLAIPRATTVTVLSSSQQQQQPVDMSDRSSSAESSSTNSRNTGALPKIKSRQVTVVSETDSDDDASNLGEDGRSSIELFLIAWGLVDFVKL